MKIAIAALNLEMPSGGTRQIFAFAQCLKKNGDTVVVYAPRSNSSVFPELQSGLDIRRVSASNNNLEAGSRAGFLGKLAAKLAYDLQQTKEAKAIVEAMDNDFDVVNYHDFAYKIGFFYKKKNNKAKLVWTMNEPPFSYLPKDNFFMDIASRAYNGIKELAEKKFLRAADIVVTLDRWDKEWAERRGRRAVIVWSGLDFDKFYKPVKKRKRPTKEASLLTVGNPNRYRRFEDAVEAVGILREQGYDIRLTVNARNIWNEDEYCRKLVALRQKYGLEKAVHFFFEGVSEEKLRQIYEESDIFVHPIYVPPPRNGSTWGLVVFEAMAAGKPVILCRTAGAAEPLTDGENALFVDPMSPEQIAEKIKLLLEDPNLYNAIAENGQNFVKENISWEKYTKNLINLFHSL